MKLILNDIELLQALQKRDAKAFEQFYNQAVVGLCYFLENRVGDKPAAEDIATDSFIKVFKRIDDFPSIGKLKSFLYTTANNAAIDHINAKKRHNVSHEEIGYLSKGVEENVEVQFIRAEAMQAIYREIDNLPPQCREVVRLSIIEGQTIQEVAEEMNISYKTVQHYKTQGLKTLRIALSKNQLLPVTVLLTSLGMLSSFLVDLHINTTRLYTFHYWI